MSLRFGLLGLLAESEASGYELSRRFQETLHAAWPASHPQIYTELNKLADENLIEVTSRGPRGRKTYRITPLGLAAVKKWLAQSKVDHTFRSDSLLRSFFFWLMEPADLQKHLIAEQAFFEARVAEYKEYIALKEDPSYIMTPPNESLRVTLEAGVRLYQSLADWAEWAQKHTKDDL